MVYSAYIRPEPRPEEVCRARARAKGEEHMPCKLPMAEVLGSYIHRIHHIAMIHVIYTLIAWFEDAIFNKVVYNIMRYIQPVPSRVIAAISGYMYNIAPWILQV